MAKADTANLNSGSPAASISEKQWHGRAANAIAELLMRKLLVPKIFLESKVMISREQRRLDIIAIDRAGSGDIHIVEIKRGHAGPQTERALSKWIRVLLEEARANFKYLAVDKELVGLVSQQSLFAKDGIGRIGVIEIVEDPVDPPRARIVIPAERFRLDAKSVKKFDDFQKKTPADMEIRA